MFKRLFNIKAKHTDGLSKVDYWKKWELFKLFDELHKGERLLIEIAINNFEDQFLKFKNDYIEELYEIEGNNVADFTRIWEWFTPTKEWEMLLGDKGKEIGDNVFRITDKWKRNQVFLLGTKVSLEKECGVVLDKSEDWIEYGLIRWDTDKENDIEDWRGLFGSFLDAGGQVINHDHEFKFINNDGTTKKASS
ncbi:MAG: hypothetical protein ACOVSR_12460 [Bacteroidia bacterium]